jgi:hypothetical protein
MSENKSKQSTECGALWQAVSKATNMKYYNGNVTVNGVKHEIVVFKNKYKQANDRQPDWRIYLSTPRETPATTPAAAPRAAAVASAPKVAPVQPPAPSAQPTPPPRTPTPRVAPAPKPAAPATPAPEAEETL